MCDTLCILSSTEAIFAKNSDRPPHEPQVVRAFPARAARTALRTQYLEIEDAPAAAFLGSQPTWLWGVEHGVNQHGVAIGNEKVWTTSSPRSRPAALIGMDIVRLGLERARNADDALDVMTALIERHGQGGSGERDHDEPYDSSFLVADASAAWVLETSDRTWVARPAPTGAAISNRLSIETDWTRASSDVEVAADFQAWRNPVAPTSIADHRLARTQRCVATAKDAATVVAALRDHGHGPWGAPGDRPERASPLPETPGIDNRGVTVCMHVPGVQATTASLVTMIPVDAAAPIRWWCALGSPCVSVYVPGFLDAGVPSPLSDDRTWFRFAALRDRVTQHPAWLMPTHRRLAAAESELWERAAELDPHDATVRNSFTAHAFDPVEAALRDLGV